MLVPPAHAVTISPGELGLPVIGSIGELVSNIWNLVLYGAGILMFFYLLFGGFKYITAGGDEKAVQTAQKMLTNAVVGMLIVFAAYWIVMIVEAILEIDILT